MRWLILTAMMQPENSDKWMTWHKIRDTILKIAPSMEPTTRGNENCSHWYCRLQNLVRDGGLKRMSIKGKERNKNKYHLTDKSVEKLALAKPPRAFALRELE
jgi:hypothetical protein